MSKANLASTPVPCSKKSMNAEKTDHGLAELWLSCVELWLSSVELWLSSG